MDKLLRRLPAEYMERIVTHDHFGLASERNLKGVHLKMCIRDSINTDSLLEHAQHDTDENNHPTVMINRDILVSNLDEGYETYVHIGLDERKELKTRVFFLPFILKE